MPKGPVIGIDFGTCNSRVGIYRNGKFEIIPNDKGNKDTPSVVAFTDAGVLVGEAALEQAADNTSNTVFGTCPDDSSYVVHFMAYT